ncbi:MAG: class I poly(R)-hydroxyalkanoic acid synthase, partial [Pseudomonadota bacterium]|nr:class I poly(R)-hydroxyalkanoic acid synthase [Pseudomonadota bacterium]
MADTIDAPKLPSLEDMQHWTYVMGRAQQLMMEHVARQVSDAGNKMATSPPKLSLGTLPGASLFADPSKLAQAQVDMWTQGMAIWQNVLGRNGQKSEIQEKADKDKRFNSPEWRQNPLFDMIRQSYVLISDRLLGSIDSIEGITDKQRQQLRFTTQGFLDAMSPSNFALTNPKVLERAVETRGESLLKGLENMLRDIEKGQLTHTDPNAFEVGRNIATTPGKVIKQTPLYQLIQYSPTTDEVYET